MELYEIVILILVLIPTFIIGVYDIINDIKKGEYLRIKIVSIILGIVIMLLLIILSPLKETFFSTVNSLISIFYFLAAFVLICGIIFAIFTFLMWIIIRPINEKLESKNEKLSTAAIHILEAIIIVISIIIAFYLTLLYYNYRY